MKRVLLLLALALSFGCSENQTDDDGGTCTADCSGKVCGSDGCGGLCAPGCDDGLRCTPAGQCEGACVPDCAGLACGDDGCGGSCGTCTGGTCDNGRCCTPDCTGRACGDDGCGGSCGTCDAGMNQICDPGGTGQCIGCTPDCTGRVCGTDGCTGSCGDCPMGEACNAAGMCEVCNADCTGLNCGDDGCGGSCGMCTAPEICMNGTCGCTADCTGRMCGADGCGGSCGMCTAPATCNGAGQCVNCVPNCGNRACGDDGCGGSCGMCPSNSSASLTCTMSGLCKCDATCTPNCGGRSCGDDGCGGVCGTACTTGNVCTYDRSRGTPWQCEAFGGAAATMSFFVTSTGNGPMGGNFGGLAGADARCDALAVAAGVTGKTWRAYLSVNGTPARGRIGTGPWFNAAGDRIGAANCGTRGNPSCLDSIHQGGLLAELVLTENGTQIDWANEHDIFTGSDGDGNPTGTDCSGWTSNNEGQLGGVGHSNGMAAGSSESWAFSHDSPCDEVGHQCTAGQGHIYCFATN